MKESYVNAFLVPVNTVCEEVFETPVKRAETEIDVFDTTAYDVTMVTHVTGGVEGTVVYGFDTDAAHALVRRLVRADHGGGAPGDVYDRQLIESAMTRLSNNIAGLVVFRLREAGYRCEIKPHSVVIGKGAVLDHGVGRQLRVGFRSSNGNFDVRLRLSETAVVTG
ncbi:MAG: chemotaxis protein CheX [Dehalococcoidia bacterium]